MISVYSDMSFNLNNNDFAHQKLQNVLACSPTKDHSNSAYSSPPLPVMITDYTPQNQCYRPAPNPPFFPVRSSCIQQQVNHSITGMPVVNNSLYYPFCNAFTHPPPPPPLPSSSSITTTTSISTCTSTAATSINHNQLYPTPSFNQQQQYGLNMTVSPLINAANSPCQMYDTLLPNDLYTMHHHRYHRGRRSSANTSRSSSPQQQDVTHSRPTSPVNKRYSCRICNKRFTRPSSLTTHMYSHTGEKPFKCPVEGCGRNFSVVSNLRRHAKVHGGSNILSTSSSSSTVYSSYSP